MQLFPPLRLPERVGIAIAIVVLGVAASTSLARDVIHQESFEAPPGAGPYTVLGEFLDFSVFPRDFFIHADNTFPEYPVPPANPDGQFYYVIHDSDNTGGLGPPGGVGQIILDPVVVTGFTNLAIRVAAADADGGFEPDDYIEVYVVVNGGGVTSLVGAIRGTLPPDDALWDDVNLDGVGDFGVTNTFSDFRDFTYEVDEPATTLVVIVKLRSADDGEFFALDNVRIMGDAAEDFEITGVHLTPPSCELDDGQIIVQASGGMAPYQYSIDNGSNFQSSATFNNLGTGSYSIVAQDALASVAATNASLTNLCETLTGGHNIIVRPGGTLIVRDAIDVNGGNIKVQSGGAISIAGGIISNVYDFTLSAGSTFTPTGTLAVAHDWINHGAFTIDTNDWDLAITIHAGVNHALGAGDTDGDGITDHGEGCWDRNQNGIPDFMDGAVTEVIDRPPADWLADHNLPTDGSADFVDTDGDGSTNLEEYHAQTDPTNSASVLQFTGLMVDDANNVTLSWNSASNRSYIIYTTTNLLTGPGSFTSLVTAVEENASPAEHSASNQNSRGFYSLEIKP